MVPSHSFPPGLERSSLPHFQIGRAGFVDTGYSCRIDSVTQAMIVTAPPSGIASVGGYRFPLRALQEAAAGFEDGATLVTLPDPLIGQRLIGNAADRGAIQQRSAQPVLTRSSSRLFATAANAVLSKLNANQAAESAAWRRR